MTDYQLPVLRHLTADEVEPGMTIAGSFADVRRVGVAHQWDADSWWTAGGITLGTASRGYDLLAEAPKPPITLPQEFGAVIRYRNGYGSPEVAHRMGGLNENSPWRITHDLYEYSDDEILERFGDEEYEVAVWTKPGDQ